MDLLGSVWGSSGPLLVSVASLLHALGSSLRTRGSHLTTLSWVLDCFCVALGAFCFALGVFWKVLGSLWCALRSLVGEPGAPEHFSEDLSGLCGCMQGHQGIDKWFRVAPRKRERGRARIKTVRKGSLPCVTIQQ